MILRHRNVYILTSEGREYSEDGCKYVEGMIRSHVDDPCQFIFSMGDIYNKTKHMLKCLVNNPESYVAISTTEDIKILYGDSIKTFKDRLKTETEKTSWQIALELAEELKIA